MTLSPCLAIIIPAYRAQFIRETLLSLANQTNKNFTLYIGDDNSPDNLETIVKQYESLLPINYTKFPNNIGSKSLVAQWERCIALSKNEEWIWLLPDDDVPDTKCVEAFFQSINEIQNKSVALVRFNTNIINEKSQLVEECFPNPKYENGASFFIDKLRLKRNSTLGEYIFSRKIYEEKNGFIDFPMAWFSDDATWLKFSSDKEIYTISGPRLNFRMSDHNISSSGGKFRDEKIDAFLMYMEWLKKNFNDFFSNIISINEFTEITQRAFNYQLKAVNASYSIVGIIKTAWRVRKIWGWGFKNQLYPVVNYNKYGITWIGIRKSIKRLVQTQHV